MSSTVEGCHLIRYYLGGKSSAGASSGGVSSGWVSSEGMSSRGMSSEVVSSVRMPSGGYHMEGAI